MSCWVVPSVAAELWGVSIAQVLDRIRKGDLPAKTELGFCLVDVAPNSPRITTGFITTRPLTYTPVLADELSDEEELALAGVSASADSSDGDEDDTQLNWRQTRTAVARTRKAPPGAFLADAAA